MKLYTNLIPRVVINLPETGVYIDNFGSKKDNYCLISGVGGKIIGAVWIRILSDNIKGYRNIDNEIPRFVISLYKEYRN